MTKHARPRLAFAAVLVLSATALQSAPQLSIPPFAYQLVSVTRVDSTQPAYDLTFRAGILNSGDLAVNVTAQLTSTSALISVLDGSLTFGNVVPTRIGRLAFSRDTFRVRLTLPRAQPLARVILIADSVLVDLQWTIACDNCGARLPIADAGPDQTARSQQVVQLDGSGSIDPDGGALTYAWTLVTAPEGSHALLQEPDSVRATIRPDRSGDYVARLVVRSAAGASLPDTVRVTTVNSAPVANAGADQTVFAGTTVALDGTRSTDVDGDALTYRWTIAEAPDLSAAEIANPSAATALFTPDVIGTYRLDLVVNDGTVDSSPDAVVITTPPGNSAPVAEAGPDQSLPLGATAFLDGGASHDADGDPLTFAWSLVSRPTGSAAALSNATAATPSFLLDAPGSYVAQLTVSDGKASAADTVVISTLNGRPTAVPGPDQTLHVGGVAALDGRASRDPDGDPLTFRWALLNVPAGSAAQLSSPTSATPDFVADRPGLYTAQLIVNDGQIDSQPATVNVTATNLAPVARDDQASTSAGTSVVIDVLSNDSDPDGDLLELVSISAPPAHGAASVVSGQVHYSPGDGFDGTDSFSYSVTDGAESATAIVTVAVRAVPPPPGPVARLELGPSAVLLTTTDERRALAAQAFDAAGVPTFVPAQALEYVSSNEEQIQVVNGVVQALVIPGSALVRVRLANDPSIVSAPVAVTAADVNPDVVVIGDDEIMDEPVPVDIADRRYAVRLSRSFDAGTLILNSGGKPVMGRVASVDPLADDGTFRTEVRLVPLTAIFQNLSLSYSFTPEELSGLTQAESVPLLAAPEHVARSMFSAAAAAPSDAGACSLDFSSTELTGDVAGNVTASLGFDLDLAISEGSLQRFKVIASGSLEGSLTLTASIGAAVEVEGSCKKKLATILVPIGGPLSLLVGARVPLGFSGSLALLVQQNLATITVAQDLVANLVLGVVYEGGQFIPVNMLNVGTTPATTVVDIPASSLRFKGKAFLGGTAGISLGVLGTGLPLFDLAEVSGGPQFEARFGEPYDASTDTAYTPGYELKVVGKAGPGTDITNAFKEIFGAVPPPFDLTLQIEFPWASSPQPGAVLKADRAAFAAGDSVTFQVDLAPGSESFPLVGYNVSEIRVYQRDEASSSARLVASAPGVPGKTSFELPWTADRDGRTVNPTSGRDNFYAFVVPVLLSTPSATYPLELGAVRGVAPIEIIPRDVVLGTGSARQFSARIDGKDTTEVTWTATGGTISPTGVFQSGSIPGTYTVTVARADAPGVTDEATVDVRPHCVPGSGAGYCGFNFATRSLPGPLVWQSVAVNDNGDWVGWAEDGNGVRTVYIGRGDSFRPAPGLNPPSASTPLGVDRPVGRPRLTNTNAFVGSFVTTNGVFRGFVFENGAPLFLDPLPGDSSAFAFDVNDDLVVVGSSFGPSGYRAVRWVNGVAEDLGLGAHSTASAINTQGQILVTTGLTPSAIQIWHNGVVTTLQDSSDCTGQDINSSGDVVGSCIIDRSDPAHPVSAAFVWRDGNKQPLDGAFAVNDSGDVLATYGLPGSSQRLWRDGVEYDIDRTGTFLSVPANTVGWTFTSISPNKSILAGTSVNCPTVSSCFTNVWIAYPIELVVR